MGLALAERTGVADDDGDNYVTTGISETELLANHGEPKPILGDRVVREVGGSILGFVEGGGFRANQRSRIAPRTGRIMMHREMPLFLGPDDPIPSELDLLQHHLADARLTVLSAYDTPAAGTH